MPKNYLIGIGGTGARVIESVLHLCAAGYGPDSLSVFLVDPDKANQDLADTSTLLQQYKNASLGWSGRPSQSYMQPFRTKISFAREPIWSIFKKTDVTLSAYFNEVTLRIAEPGYAALISALFTRAELNTPLTRGFRGHPSIGAAVMSNVEDMSLDGNEEMKAAEGLRQLWADVGSGPENDVRVFVVGSVFGGTGAAGVPTFGHGPMLKWHDKAKIVSGGSRILLGGALVLPYFKFAMDADSVDKAKNELCVTPDDFSIATKAALEYYEDADLAYDQLYLIGDSLRQSVGKFGTGGKEQNNDPHYVELVTGLAAIDFWEEGPKSADVKEFFIAAREGAGVSWSDLPVTRNLAPLAADTLQSKLRLQCAAMSTFGYVLNSYGADFLSRAHGSIDNKSDWYTKHFKFDPNNALDKEKNPRDGLNKGVIDAVSIYSREFVKWLAAIGKLESVSLVDGTKLMSDTTRGAMMPPMQFKSNIGAFLQGRPAVTANASFDDYLNKFLLKLEERNDSLTAADTFLNLLYKSAFQFCTDTYGLQEQ